MLLVPLLEDGHRAAGDLDIQLNVFSNAGPGEVRRADQRRRADDFKPSVGDVGLGWELLFAIDATHDLARANGVDDRGDPGQEVVGLLGLLDARVELAGVFFFKQKTAYEI